MATVGLVPGTLLRLYDGSTAIARATECSVSFNVETQSISHKDSTGGWASTTLGEKSGTATCNFLFEEVAGGFAALWAKFIAGTVVVLKMTTAVTGDSAFSGNAYITSMELTGTHKEVSTASISFTFDGAVAKTTVA